MITPLERIRAEVEAATPGPWAWMGGCPDEDRYEALESPTERVLGSERALAYHTCLSEPNATLIANAPTYLAALLDVAETAERVIGAFSNTYFTAARQEGKTRIAAALNDLHDALGKVPSS